MNYIPSNFFSKTITFTKFFEKSVREFLEFPHAQCAWKLLPFNLTHFWQKFREINDFTKEITKELIS